MKLRLLALLFGLSLLSLQTGFATTCQPDYIEGKDLSFVSFVDGEWLPFDPADERHKLADKNWIIDEGKPNPEDYTCPDPGDPYNPDDPYKTGNETYLKNRCRIKLNELIAKCQTAKNELLDQKEAAIADWQKETQQGNIEEAYSALRSEFPSVPGDFKTGDNSAPFDPDTFANNKLSWDQQIEVIRSFDTEKDEDLKKAAQKIVILYNSFTNGMTSPQIQDRLFEDPVVLLAKEEFEAVDSGLKTILASEEDYPRTGHQNEIDTITAKIHYLESRTSALTRSLFVSGSTSFEVSDMLTTRSSDGEDKSREGDLSIIKSRTDEVVCANLKNTDQAWKDFGCGDNLFDKIIRLASQIVGTLGVILLLIAAIMLITARGDESQTQKGKEMILYTLGGLLVFFMSFIAVQFIIDLLVW